MIIDVLPIWALFFVTAAFIVAMVEVGFRIGKRVLARTDQERESPVSAIAGAILGLTAFMLAFTFSMASDRYDTKKGLVREEANVLRTTWERSDLLREPDRAKTKELLREYVDDRIAFAQARDPEKTAAGVADAFRIQREIWTIGVDNARSDPFMFSDIGSLYIDSINRMSELNALRYNLGLQARIPSGIWFVLFALIVLGMLGVGYQTAIAGSRRPRVTSILAISFSLVIALIAALDHPMNSFISIPQAPLVNLQTEMNAPAPPIVPAKP
ncbi:MAG TPA: hypothetical protein PLL77_13940 [Pyrinomonadaceae bacterium]|nr:hypothetical protein [Pyrinomonadaceae bacterium]